MQSALIWAALVVAMAAPLIAAAFSPYLAFRQPIYIAAGFAGIAAMVLLLLQPLLAAGILPGLAPALTRRLHRFVAGLIVVLVLVHVVGLWITSPPDVIDALTFTSPTPFSPFGVIAMWALFGMAIWAALRRRLRTKPQTWRRVHPAIALIVAACTVVHALLIEGTMEAVSKWALSALVLLSFVVAIRRMRPRT